MKVHYINILLFALPLNILVINQRNHNNSTYHTSNTKLTKTHRTLCECELYAPSNYENDPEMKELMENFNHQSSERFREYDERIQDKRKQFKEQCEKDIQKIILKDKIEKELTEKLSTLQTDISTNDIPTCVCEKSMADKTEKFCFKCGRNLGGIAPWWGLVNGILYAGWINYTNTTLVKIATDAGIAEAVKVGLVKVAEIVKQIYGPSSRIPLIDGTKLISAGKFTEKISLYDIGKTIDSTMAIKLEAEGYSDYCFTLQSVVKPNMLKTFPQHAAAIETAFNEAQTGVLTEGASTTSSLTTAITTSIVAIVIIILVVIIIYLILRYRRKKKMKKKLQYIKLLKE